jgi:hypothetical protein
LFPIVAATVKGPDGVGLSNLAVVEVHYVFFSSSELVQGGLVLIARRWGGVVPTDMRC